MNRREIWIYTTILLLVMVLTTDLVMTALTSKHLTTLPTLWRQESTAVALNSQCSDKPPIAELAKAQDPHLRKLAEYQTACQSFVSNEVMIFTDMPKDNAIAQSDAIAMAKTLKEYAKYGVTPLVIVEPVTNWGLTDFKEFESGFYDEWIQTYFKTLQAQGISSQMMGTWVPFPEANLPYWNQADAKPADFASVVNRYLGMMKQSFPAAKGSILLNSATYDTKDFNWENGEYLSLQPYVSGIQKGLVDSFGIQGFSWSPSATSPGPGIFDAAEYLNSRLAIEAADALGVKNIWFNTGSWSDKYTGDPDKTVTLSASKRKDVLNGILAEVQKTKNAGYNVTINLFAQDKSKLDEATNWSYWPDGQVTQSLHTPVFIHFRSQLEQAGIPLSLFDQSL